MQMVACCGTVYACSNVSVCTDWAALKTAVDACVGPQSCAAVRIADWDVSAVTDMSDMFKQAANFNADVSGWDVSAVTDVTSMFDEATNFNGDLSGWNVGGVATMDSIFYGASSFNGDVSGWDVGGITTTDSIFYGASSFNGDVSGWDVGGITTTDPPCSGKRPTLTAASPAGTSAASSP